MAKRKSLTKKIRFEVFKRDNFICQYCGKTPPNITLEIDHLIPISKGGDNDINNLIISCFDCNRGKSNIELKTIPNSIKDNYDILKEKQLQLKEYQKLIRQVNKAIEKDINIISEAYTEWFPNYILSEKFKKSTVKMFLQKIPSNYVLDAMHNSCSKINDKDNSIRYFCGICWSIIKNGIYG